MLLYISYTSLIKIILYLQDHIKFMKKIILSLLFLSCAAAASADSRVITVKECIDIALQNHPDYFISIEDQKRSISDYGEARSQNSLIVNGEIRTVENDRDTKKTTDVSIPGKDTYIGLFAGITLYYNVYDAKKGYEEEMARTRIDLSKIQSQKTRLEIDFTVERGRGYTPANERNESLPIGELPVDAIFTPVRRVNWSVQNARVGTSTNYDKLVLEIWTDGTLSPQTALSTGSKILIDHLRMISGVTEEIPLIGIERETTGSRLTSEAAETPIENLDLSVRVFNSLKRTGIATVGDVLDLLEKGEEAVMSIRNFGEKSLDELRQKMQEKGFLQEEKPTE